MTVHVFNLLLGSTMVAVTLIRHFHTRRRKATVFIQPADMQMLVAEKPTVKSVAEQPIPMRAFDFDVIVGKVQGRLIMHRSTASGEVSRILLLQASLGKTKTIRLDPIRGKIDDVIDSTIKEAVDIGSAIFGKKQKTKMAAKTEQRPEVRAHQKAKVEEVAKAEALHPIEQAPSSTPETNEKPEYTKPKSMYYGKFVSGGIEKHLSVRDGKPEEYSSFTVTLETPEGTEIIQGNDLNRALNIGMVETGDLVRIIHVGDTEVAKGRYKKNFAVINLTKENKHECEQGNNRG